MKKFILLGCLFCSYAIMSAQSYKGVKMYGYTQSSTSGISPNVVISEDGTQVESKSKSANTPLIYLVYPSNINLQPVAIYINGIRYSLKAEKVDETPVLFEGALQPNTGKTMVLVPKTNNLVFFLHPEESNHKSISTTAKSLMKHNEVILVYLVNKKKYYSTLKNIIKLTSVPMQ
jgi:hypothetical protein